MKGSDEPAIIRMKRQGKTVQTKINIRIRTGLKRQAYRWQNISFADVLGGE